MKTENYITFKDGVTACIPTTLGYIGIGLAAGVVGKNVGLSIQEIALMSLLIYAGSAQFIICGMLTLHSPISTIILTTFLVNLRNFLMSMSVAPYFRKEPMITGVAIGSLLTDESYGVLTTAITNKKPVTSIWMQGLNVTAYGAWLIATIMGGLLGKWIPNPHILGLDYALVAMFAGLFILQIDIPIKKQTKKTVLVITTVCLSLYLCMRFFTPEISILLTTILGCTMGMVRINE